MAINGTGALDPDDVASQNKASTTVRNLASEASPHTRGIFIRILKVHQSL